MCVWGKRDFASITRARTRTRMHMYKQFIISMNRRGSASPLACTTAPHRHKVYVYWKDANTNIMWTRRRDARGCAMCNSFGIKCESYTDICARSSVCAHITTVLHRACALEQRARNDRRTHTPLRDPPRLCKCARERSPKAATPAPPPSTAAPSSGRARAFIVRARASACELNVCIQFVHAHFYTYRYNVYRRTGSAMERCQLGGSDF